MLLQAVNFIGSRLVRRTMSTKMIVTVNPRACIQGNHSHKTCELR